MSHHWNWKFLFFALLFIGYRVKRQKGATLHLEKLKSPILLFKIPILIRNVGSIHCKWWDLSFFFIICFILSEQATCMLFPLYVYAIFLLLLIAFYSFIKQESRKEQIVYIFIISGRSGCTNLRPVFQFC